MQIVIIGGANIDFVAKPNKRLTVGESAPGNIKTSVGGVAINIALSLARIKKELLINTEEYKFYTTEKLQRLLTKLEIKFCSIIGNDTDGLLIEKELKKNNIDCSLLVTSDAVKTGKYCVIQNHSGETMYGISDMNFIDLLTPEQLLVFKPEIEKAELIFIDGNLRQQQFQTILIEMNPQKVFCDPVSPQKALNLKSFLQYIYAIKPNLNEAAILTNNKEPILAVKNLREKNIQKIFLSVINGLYYNAKNNIEQYKYKIANTDSDVGLGDRLTAGLIMGELLEFPIEKQIEFAYYTLQNIN